MAVFAPEHCLARFLSHIIKLQLLIPTFLEPVKPSLDLPARLCYVFLLEMMANRHLAFFGSFTLAMATAGIYLIIKLIFERGEPPMKSPNFVLTLIPFVLVLVGSFCNAILLASRRYYSWSHLLMILAIAIITGFLLSPGGVCFAILYMGPFWLFRKEFAGLSKS